jgi:hypothetical protein
MTTVSLYDIAPRLARARDVLVEESRRERARRLHLMRLMLKAERNVAHRELQLARAQVGRDPKYMAYRERKLKAAERELARYRAL